MKIGFTILGSLLFFCLNAISQDVPEHDEYPDVLYMEASQVSNDTLQRLNLVIPKNVENPPLLLWIGGGAWSYVNRHAEMDLARKIADNGIAVASVGHRLSTAIWKDSALSQGIKHPKHAEDIAAALSWLFLHAQEYGYNRNQIFIGGFSSGAHLAALVALDEKYLKAYKLYGTHIKGIIPISGAYDISDYHQAFVTGSRKELADLHVKAVFGDTEEDFSMASPTNYLQSLSAPILLISDQNTYNYARIFEKAITSTDFNKLRVIHVDTLGHGDLWRHLSYDAKSAYRDTIIDFIKGPYN